VLKRLLALAVLPLVACGSPKPAASPSPAAAASAVPALPPPIDGTTPLPEPMPKIAATVNGHPIKLPYVDMIARGLLEQAGNQPKDRPVAYRRALLQLIVRELLFEEAVARQLSADDARVEQAYNEARVGHKDDEKWLKFLASQFMDVDTFRAEIRSQQTIAVLLAKEGEEVSDTITDGEAKAFYDGHPEMFDSGERRRVRYILLRLPPDAPPAQKLQVHAKTATLRERIRKGDDFAAIAKQFSQDQASAAKGGVLDIFGRGEMEPGFEKAAYALKQGELSEVVETPFGYNLIEVQEILPAHKLPYEGIKDRIKEVIVKQRRDERIQVLIAKLWAQARLETYL
jgi:peptidyl-prolyl cis-trans isomerase C